MEGLNYKDILNVYTLEEIKVEAEFWREETKKAVIEKYVRSKSGSTVISSSLKDVKVIYSVWLKALAIKTKKNKSKEEL